MRLQKFKIDEKRVVFPFTAVSKCPGCGAEVRFAGEVDFPTFGGKSTLYALCPNDACDYAARGLTVEVTDELD